MLTVAQTWWGNNTELSYRAAHHPTALGIIGMLTFCGLIGVIPGQTTEAVGTVASILFTVVAVWLCLARSRRTRNGGWALFVCSGLGMIALVIVWQTVALVTRREPQDNILPWTFLVSTVLLTAAFAHINLVSSSRTDFWRRTLDALTVGTGLTVPVWTALTVAPQVRQALDSPGFSPLGLIDELVLMQSSATLIVVCLAVIVRGCLHGTGMVAPAVGWLLTVSTLVTLAGLFAQGTVYVQSGQFSLALMAGYIGQSWAAIGPVQQPTTSGCEAPRSQPLLPNLAILTTAGLAYVQGIVAPVYDPVTGMMVAFMVALMVVRNQVILYSNGQLMKRLAAHEARMREHAFTDDLTGLHNRRKFSALLADHVAATAEPEGATAGTVIYLDIDRFKAINDTHGHAVGDLVLCTVADRLQMALPDAVSVTRLAGDEFVILLPGAMCPEASAKTCVMSMRPPIHADGHALIVTVSVGAATWDGGDTLDPVDILRSADDALYWVKQDGRDDYHHRHFTDPALPERRTGADDTRHCDLSFSQSLPRQHTVSRHPDVVNPQVPRRVGPRQVETGQAKAGQIGAHRSEATLANRSALRDSSRHRRPG